MDDEDDPLTKRRLLDRWLAAWGPAHRACLAAAGEPVVRQRALLAIASLPRAGWGAETIYVLLAETATGSVPAYVGRAADPLARWTQHLAGLERGRGAYARWRRALLDAQGHAVHGLRLLVVPVSEVTAPPLPGFPVTVGALEYQLVGLAVDAYPGRLLNHEGNRR